MTNRHLSSHREKSPEMVRGLLETALRGPGSLERHVCLGVRFSRYPKVDPCHRESNWIFDPKILLKK